MEKEEVETVAGQREKERFLLGKNEFLADIVVPARWARTNEPLPSGPPSGEKVREEERGRDLGGDFSEKVRERNEPRWEEGDTVSHPSHSYHGFVYFSCPTCATRAVTRETHTSMQNGSTSTPLLIVSHADTCIVHLMARARRVSTGRF